jgi:hypothetical protein
MRPNAVEGHRIVTDAVYHQKIGSEMTLGHTSPIGAALAETMLPKYFRQDASGNHQVKEIFEGLGFELGMFSRRR